MDRRHTWLDFSKTLYQETNTGVFSQQLFAPPGDNRVPSESCISPVQLLTGYAKQCSERQQQQIQEAERKTNIVGFFFIHNIVI